MVLIVKQLAVMCVLFGGLIIINEVHRYVWCGETDITKLGWPLNRFHCISHISAREISQLHSFDVLPTN